MKLKERVLIPVKQYPKVRARKERLNLWDLFIFWGILWQELIQCSTVGFFFFGFFFSFAGLQGFYC